MIRKRHLILIGFTLTLQVGCVAVINYFIDPYLLYYHRHGGAAELSRIDQFTNVRLYKPYHVSRNQPEAVIIGSSRSGTIRPRHPAWEGMVTYNLAIPGITPYELNRLVKHAQAVRPLRKLMIGLDFQTFVTPLPEFRPGFEPARQAVRASDLHSLEFNLQRLRDLQVTLFSLDVLGDSLRALDPPQSLPRRFFPDGTWQEKTTLLMGNAGYRFVAKNRLDVDFAALDTTKNMRLLRDVLDFCYENGIETHLFFTPSHSVMVDLWFRLVSHSLWRAVHSEVLRLNEELAAGRGVPAFPVWGFQAERAMVAEPIYTARNAHKAWFHDGIHYGFRLGKKIMDAVWGQQTDFGRKLTSTTLDPYLAEVDRVRAEFVRSHPKQVARLYGQIGLEEPGGD